jgi:hypothetical protein
MIYDSRALEQPLHKGTLGSGLGVPHIYFDK